MADQPFTLENHIDGPVAMEAPEAPTGPAPFTPSEHDQFAPTGPSAASGHGFLSGIAPAMSDMVHNINFADLARQANAGVADAVTGLTGLFHVETADPAASAQETIQNGVEAGMDQVLVIPDDGYDYVDAETVVAEAGDDQAHEAQAVASHGDISGQPHDHDGGYDA